MAHNSPRRELFDRQFVTNTLRNQFRCPICLSEFSYTNDVDKFDKESQYIRSHRPMLLPCNHNMCENCVYQYRNNLNCHVCLRPVNLSVDFIRQPSNFSPGEHFDMNFFLLGEINQIHSFCKDEVANNSDIIETQDPLLLDMSFTLKGSEKTPLRSVPCVECEVSTAMGRCYQCKAYLCKKCFNDIHVNIKFMTSHHYQRFSDERKTTQFKGCLKPKKCKRHNRQICDRFCLKCKLTCCLGCVRNEHQNHKCTTLLEMNNSHLHDVATTLEQVNTSCDTLKKDIEDVKFVENQLEEYARSTIEKVSNYFLQIHSILQNDEKKIIKLFNEKSHILQSQLGQFHAKLKESEVEINVMKSNLQFFNEEIPSNIEMRKFLDNCNGHLKQLAAHMKITKPVSNPFYFETKQNFSQELRKCFKYEFQDPLIMLNTCSLNNDSSISPMDTTFGQFTLDVDNSMVAPFASNRNQELLCSKLKPKKSSHRKTNKSNCIENDTNFVHRVCHIETPEHFYVQTASNFQKIQEISKTYKDNRPRERIIKSQMSKRCLYMTHHEQDNQWYRGILIKFLPNDCFKMFLIDIGIHLIVSKDKLCYITEAHKSIQHAALRCSIYGIAPTESQWNREANNFMIELLNNNPARMTILERTSSNIVKIDMETSETKSMRGSFLYTGLARESPHAINYRIKLNTVCGNVKTNEPISKSSLNDKEIVMVNVLHVDGPHKFYVIKKDQVEEKHNFMFALNFHYHSDERNCRNIFLGTVKMFCAVYINNIWYRGVIKEVKREGKLEVHLVDEGRPDIVTWRQVFILHEDFLNVNAFAACCSLADVEPLQNNSYVYTSTAVNFFKQMAINPSLRMEVVDTQNHVYKVVLYVCKNNVDLNIAAALVKNNHAVSVGETTQTMEIHQIRKTLPSAEKHLNIEFDHNLLSKFDTNLQRNPKRHFTEKTETSTVLSIQRTPVTIVHLVSPDEFYIQLSNLSQGIKAFHTQIQEAQEKKISNLKTCVASSVNENFDWGLNDHCLVYNAYVCCTFPKLIPSGCEWYRGIIQEKIGCELGEPHYVVFLRDVGATIKASKNHLFHIDSQLDRVNNAVYCCHMACNYPADGKTWAHTAVDWLRHAIGISESLSVSMHGKRPSDEQSIPVVLWSTLTETTDPLAPCITKYSNLNRALMRSGLAIIDEGLYASKQFYRLEEMEVSDEELTLEQWHQFFESNILQCGELENKEQKYKSKSFTINNDCFMFEVEGNAEDHPFRMHLKDFDLTATTGQSKPPLAWQTAKDINKTLFTGYPTYIDYNCIVYLHEAEDKAFLEMICSIISRKYEELPQPNADYKFTIGQAVIARYHLDNKCYRAVIERDVPNKQGEVKVLFIDYGNIDDIKLEDIRPYALFPNLPTIANKYVISGIKPKNGATEYSQQDLDQMHLEIVGKLVSVRLPPSELGKKTKLCCMRLGTKDVASKLIERQLAEEVKLNATIQQLTPLVESFDISHPNKFPNTLSRGWTFQDPIIDYKADCGKVDPKYYQMDSEVSRFDIACGDNSEDKLEYNHINRVFPHFRQDKDGQLPTNHVLQHKSASKPGKLSSKKRMFNGNDYMQMVGSMTDIDSDGIQIDYLDVSANDDEDMVELGHKFTMSYWHKSDLDVNDEETEALFHSDRKAYSKDDEDIVSEFETFHPNDTSTVVSHRTPHKHYKRI